MEKIETVKIEPRQYTLSELFAEILRKEKSFTGIFICATSHKIDESESWMLLSSHNVTEELCAFSHSAVEQFRIQFSQEPKHVVPGNKEVH